MRPSEKVEAKAAGQKCSEAWFSPRRGFLHVENVFGRQRRHRALQPAAIERVIGIGSNCIPLLKTEFFELILSETLETISVRLS